MTLKKGGGLKRHSKSDNSMKVIWWILLVLATTLEAKNLHLCSDSSYDLAPYVSFLEDPSRDLNLSDVVDKQFAPIKKRVSILDLPSRLIGSKLR